MKQLTFSIFLMLLPLLASAEAVEKNGIYYNLIAEGNIAEVTSNPDYYSEEIIIPSTVTHKGQEYTVAKIGDNAFDGCQRLTSVTIPNSVTSIGDHAFDCCYDLTSVNLGNSVTSIGNYAFYFCNQLRSITIPNSVTTIGDHAFQECRFLDFLTIPNSVISIGDHAFQYCGLSDLTIGSSVKSIGSNAFYACFLTSLTIPNSVTSIGGGAFSNSSLTSVTIGKNVNTINNYAFSSCKKLTDVYCLAENVPNTGTDVFYESSFKNATLHVPAASLDNYKGVEPWKSFKNIVALDGGKCATPEISYANGMVSLSCETEGVEFISEVTVDDAKKYYDSEFTLSQTYRISVYATKAGYENSDVATREIVIENGKTTLLGDLNKDGKVDVSDHVKLSDIIMNK